MKWTLRYSKSVLAVSFLIFIGSLFLVKTVKQEFVPGQDQNLIMLSGQTPTGTALEATYAKAIEIEEIIKKNQFINRYFVSVGSGYGSSGTNGISMPLYLTPRETRAKTHVQIMADLRKRVESAQRRARVVTG